MEKLKLAVFNTQPPHLYFGGVERRILETGKRLSGEMDFTVYSGTKLGFHAETNVNGIKIVPCKSTDRLFPLDNWTFNRTLEKMANKLSADVFEAHNVSGYKIQKALKRNNRSVPFITTVHGVLADEYNQAQTRGDSSPRAKLANFFMKGLGEIEKESANDAAIVVTISKYSQRKIEELYGVEASKIRIIPNGVDSERFKPIADCSDARKRIGAVDRQVVFFVGRLIPRKGLNFLIEAAKQVTSERRETLFVVAGDGPLKSQLMSTVEKTNLSNNFKFLGDVSDEQLPSLYSCSDVFAFPSIQEGQGIALLEAQSSGKPVAAFNISGVSEAVLNGETGLLVQPESNELADAILNLLSDEALRVKFGKRGRERIEKEFTWDLCAKRMLQTYFEAKKCC